MTVSDDEMRAMLATTVPYTAVLLRHGPAYGGPETPGVVWEHGRRNFELRADGRLAIVLPVRDESDLAGIGIFALDEAATRAVMDGDPGVRAGIFTYEVHPTRSFPGDALPPARG
jgi:hypothetical protein